MKTWQRPPRRGRRRARLARPRAAALPGGLGVVPAGVAAGLAGRLAQRPAGCAARCSAASRSMPWPRSRTRSASSGTTRCAAPGSSAPPSNRRGRGASIDATMSKTEPAGNAFKGRTGLDRIVRATGYSLDGLRLAYGGESAFRQEVWAALVLLPACALAGPDLGRGGAAGRIGAAGDDRRAAQLGHRGGDRPRRASNCTISPSAPRTWPALPSSCRCCCAPAVWAAALWHRLCRPEHDRCAIPAVSRSASTAARATASAPRSRDAARRLGRAIGERGWQLVYGGGNVGLMGEVADAALAAGAPRGRRHPARADGARGRPPRPAPSCTSSRRCTSASS